MVPYILKLVIWMPLSSISNRERFVPRLHWESFRGNGDLRDHHQGQEMWNAKLNTS